jgi:hypothetical protein
MWGRHFEAQLDSSFEKQVVFSMFRWFTVFGLMTCACLAQPETPTFYRNVLPIMQRQCQPCHRPGEVAPMPLMTYAQVRPWASAIRQQVLLRSMPPWFADPQIGHFSNDRSLTQAEIKTISDWVSSGAPAGNAKDAPPARAWSQGWNIGKPDVEFAMPKPFQIPATGVLAYEYMIVPTHFTRDTWVQFAEVRAGDRARTHHIVVSIREPDSQWLRAEPVGVPFTMHADGRDDGIPGEFLAGYGPGAMPETFAPGQAKLIKAGSDLVFQLHYTPNGTPGCDQSRIGLRIARVIPKQRVFMLAAANVRFRIPPGDPEYRVDAKLTLQHEARLVSLLPHMHLRGKSFEFRMVLPDGKTETLLRVPHYSYDWQLSYYPAEQRILPAGTVIECTATFDNSANNPRNPDPSKTVRFGPQSSDEMMIGYFEVATDRDASMRDLLVP